MHYTFKLATNPCSKPLSLSTIINHHYTCKKIHALTLEEDSREADRSIYSLSAYHTSPHDNSRRAKASSVSSKKKYKMKEGQIKREAERKQKIVRAPFNKNR